MFFLGMLVGVVLTLIVLRVIVICSSTDDERGMP